MMPDHTDNVQRGFSPRRRVPGQYTRLVNVFQLARLRLKRRARAGHVSAHDLKILLKGAK